MQNFHPQDSKNFDRCMAYLCNSTLKQNDKKLTQLINDFDHDPLAIKLLISYLEYWHDSEISGLEQIPILHDSQAQDRNLRRLLCAFEYKFSGYAELTLLYLLSLSAKPVSLQQMEQTFHCPLIARLLTRGDEYQSFLMPLHKLNHDGWQDIVENLHNLGLLGYAESTQGTLLVIEPRICHYFRQKLETQKYRILQPAYRDMLLATSKTTSYAMPPTFQAPRHNKPVNQQKNREIVAMRAERSRKQLHALRKSLKVLAEQSRELNILRQAPVQGNDSQRSTAAIPNHAALIPEGRQAA